MKQRTLILANFVKITCCFTCASYISILGFVNRSLADDRVDVSQELAVFASKKCAEEFYGGKLSVWDVSLYYSMEGESEAYCIVLHRGDETSRSKKDVIREIKEAKESIRQQENDVNNLKTRRDREQIKKDIRRQKSEKVYHLDDFVTIFAGAHEGHTPVIRMQKGLPPDMTTLDDVKEHVKAKHKIKSVKLRRKIFYDQLSVAFEMEPSDEDETVDMEETEPISIFPGPDSNLVVDPFSLASSSVGEIRKRLSAKENKMIEAADQQANQDRLNKLREKWDHYKTSFTLQYN